MKVPSGSAVEVFIASLDGYAGYVDEVKQCSESQYWVRTCLCKKRKTPIGDIIPGLFGGVIGIVANIQSQGS